MHEASIAPPPLIAENPPPQPQIAHELYQTFMAFWNAIEAQAQGGQVPPMAPHPPPAPVNPAPTYSSIASKTKEVIQLGYKPFQGNLDTVVAKNWVRKVDRTMTDIGLTDDMKLKVATQLLEGAVEKWWENVQSRTTTLITWATFLAEFDTKYFTFFHQKEKREEFLQLQQGDLTVEEIEAKFNELLLFVGDMIRGDYDQASFFESKLKPKIREWMLVTGEESNKHVIQSALKAEKLISSKGKAPASDVPKRK